GRPARIDIRRWSDDGRRARWGEIYAARVRAAEPGLRGAFLDLGLKDEQGFLPFDAHGHIRLGRNTHRAAVEGEAILARITREGANGKTPVLAFVEDAPSHPRLGRVVRAERDEEEAPPPADPEIRERIDAAVESAVSRVAPLDGGGRLIIERAAALTAIDVDSGGRRGSGDSEAFARALNI